MLTFDEACHKILIRCLSDENEKTDDMDDASEKFISLHKEIQTNENTVMFVSFLMAMGEENDIPQSLLLAVALSHGVALGIEMERQEI